MHYLIVGLLLALIVYAALRAFLSANPKSLAKSLKNIGLLALLLLAAFFAVTGRLAAAGPLFLFAVTLLVRNLASGAGGFNPFRGSAHKSSGQRSRVRTATVEMELDHDSGEMFGSVLSGRFASRTLSSMTQIEVSELWEECLEVDPQAAQLIEAYMERNFRDWRGEAKSSGQAGGGATGARGQAGGPMTRDEACEILGLKPDASRSDIMRAHRKLMKKLHPDHGGSTYLAAKINQAKDLLLRK